VEIARDELGIPTIERSIDRGELYAADEIFFTGTAVGICPVASVDRRIVGDGAAGPITQRLRALYDRIVTGCEPRFEAWLTRTYASAKISA
jgi:branched-chain amino acid aminotransferase